MTKKDSATIAAGLQTNGFNTATFNDPLLAVEKIRSNPDQFS